MERSALESDIQYLPGVGPKRAELLRKELGINTFGDLIRLYPFRYIDRSSIVPEELWQIKEETLEKIRGWYEKYAAYYKDMGYETFREGCQGLPERRGCQGRYRGHRRGRRR